MSFLLPCPLCGPRDAYEFRYGGEVKARPVPGSAPDVWATYLYLKANAAGPERAWWYHSQGCRRWFQAGRDTRDNRVTGSSLPVAGKTLLPPGEGELPSTSQGEG